MIVVGYLLSLATCIPASGWLGDRFGTKRTFLSALAVFAIASALCGVAQSLGQLVAFRMLQAWRPIEDAVSALVCHGAPSRFPQLKIAVIDPVEVENPGAPAVQMRGKK